MSESKLLDRQIGLINKFEDFIHQHGIFLIQCFAAATTEKTGNYYKRSQGSIIESDEETKIMLSECFFGGAFFRWLIPDNRLLGNEDFGVEDRFILERPKSAIGPYDYEDTLIFNDNTIVHGFCEGWENHVFFAICINGIVTIFNTYGGTCEMFIIKHRIEDANKIISQLSDEKSDITHSEVAANFFGIPVYEMIDTPYKFIMHQHSLWLPSFSMIYNYLSVLEKHMFYEEDKLEIQRIKSRLKE